MGALETPILAPIAPVSKHLQGPSQKGHASETPHEQVTASGEEQGAVSHRFMRLGGYCFALTALRDRRVALVMTARLAPLRERCRRSAHHHVYDRAFLINVVRRSGLGTRLLGPICNETYVVDVVAVTPFPAPRLIIIPVP